MKLSKLKTKKTLRKKKKKTTTGKKEMTRVKRLFYRGLNKHTIKTLARGLK